MHIGTVAEEYEQDYFPAIAMHHNWSKVRFNVVLLCIRN